MTNRQAAAPSTAAHRRPRLAARRRTTTVVAAATAPPTAPPPSSSSPSSKPAWTGDSLLSRAVNGAIANPVLFGAMRVLAKAAMRRSARERGVDWAAHVDALSRRERDVLRPLALEFARGSGLGMGPYENENGDATTTSTSQYPSYYLKPFHSYEQGNLEWIAAYEVEPASLAIAMRTFAADAPPAASADSPEMAAFAANAMARMRQQITQAVREYVVDRQGLPLPRRVLDAGCSTGISTRWLGAEFEKRAGAGGEAAAAPLDALVGLDLSPYFLAVAEDEERRRWGQDDGEGTSDADASSSALLGARAAPKTLTRPTYVHGLAERAPFPDASFDLVAFNFVAHECPGVAIDAFCAEAKRLLEPGRGVLYFSDNDPQSATIQNLPAPIFTLMKSTEPWSDEYYSFSLEDALRRAGFVDVVKVASDHRHRVVMGRRGD
jgi:SAM-dependent methyltransferase